MGFFRKKIVETSKVEIEIPKSPCEIFGHNWRDFPPYLEFSWNGKSQESFITIKECYICTCCHKLQEKSLLSRSYKGYSEDHFFNQIKEYKEEYKDLLKPEAVVKDMIQDAIMVDRQRLKYWDSLHADKPPEKEPFEFKIEETKKNKEGKRNEMDKRKMGRNE